MSAVAAVPPANLGRELLYQAVTGPQRRLIYTEIANLKFKILRVQATNKYAQDDALLPEPRYKITYYSTETHDFVKYLEPLEDAASLSLELVDEQEWPRYFQRYLNGRFRELARSIFPNNDEHQNQICAYLNSKIGPANDPTGRVFKLFLKILLGKMKSKAQKEDALFDKRENLVNKYVAAKTQEERDFIQGQIDQIELLIDQLTNPSDAIS